MNKVLKKALGFASALVLMAVMVLAASPVQASDVDARIQALERELVQLKQNQEVANESALAAEAKGPSFKYAAGKGLKIAAADNNWSITFGQRLQVYSSLWLTNDAPATGVAKFAYKNGQLRVRRFRPYINVTSQQGFYEVKWTFSGGGDKGGSMHFDGDVYLHFEKMNPWLPTVGYGYNPSFGGNQGQSAGRTEDSLFINSLGLGGSQDSSVVLAWKKLPAMGMAKVRLELAMGLDQGKEYEVNPNQGTDDGGSMAFALGVSPLSKLKSMGGFNVSNVTYNFAYESLSDRSHGTGNLSSPTTQSPIELVKGPKATGDHTYMFHGLAWSPLKWLALNAHLATYEADADNGNGNDIDASEVRLAATLWLWGPKSGMMGGSKTEGGISVSPMYSNTNFDSPMSGDASNNGVAVVYNVPGGWMQIHGVWDSLGCEGDVCVDQIATADDGDDSTNVFTLIVEYRF